MEISLEIRLINFILLSGIYIFVTLSVLISLRKRQFSRRHTAFWVLVILFFPFLGAIAYWIVNPKNEAVGKGRRRELKA